MRGDQHIMSSCEPPTKKIYLYPYFMFKKRAGEGCSKGRRGEGSKTISFLSKHSHQHLTNDLCKFFLFSHDPISRLFESFLGTFIKDQKIAN